MSVPANLDHLVYVCNDLEDGIAELESKLGVAPAKGGSHPKFGTCNALLSLGDKAYIELLAPDPALAGPAQEAWLETLPENRRLVTWVMRANNLNAAAQRARAAGGAIGETLEGSRQQPDGTMLKWELTAPAAMPFDGAVPFLINWGRSPHPAQHAPRAGTLTKFVIEHPQAGAIRGVFDAMGEDVEVQASEQARLSATVETASGLATLS